MHSPSKNILLLASILVFQSFGAAALDQNIRSHTFGAVPVPGTSLFEPVPRAPRQLDAEPSPGPQPSREPALDPDNPVHDFDDGSGEQLRIRGFVVELLAVWLSIMVGQLLHRHHWTRYLPESAASVCVGLAVGGLVRVNGVQVEDAELADSVGFGTEFFSLALLPIIIFESGYSLRKRFFFANLGSITVFAIVGTLLSAIVIGLLVWGAGKAGASISIGWAEAFTLASLLSATDPVATLAVFGALKVDPTLNSLVYGESVLNDAVGIVLFRTFAQWIGPGVVVTGVDIFKGLGLFLGILLGSAVMGTAMGFPVTLMFRVAHLGWVPCSKVRKQEETGQVDTAAATAGSLANLQRLEMITRASQPSSPVPGSIIVVSNDTFGQPYTLPAPPAPASVDGEPTAPRTPTKNPVRVPPAPSVPEVAYSDGDAMMQSLSLLLFCYSSYWSAEAVGMSGIVASLFAGIQANHYTRAIMPANARLFSGGLLKSLATLADTAVFCTIGLDVADASLDPNGLLYEWRLIAVTVVACLIGRAANVFPLAAALNLRRKDPIAWNYQLQMWHAGLRGAIAYASASDFPTTDPVLKRQMKGVTAAIVIFTIFVMGCTCETALKVLHVPYGEEAEKAASEAHAAASAHAVRAARDKRVRSESTGGQRREGAEATIDEWQSPSKTAQLPEHSVARPVPSGARLPLAATLVWADMCVRQWVSGLEARVQAEADSGARDELE